MFSILAFALGHQRHFAVVVDKTDSPEPLMEGSFFQAQRSKVAELHAAIGKRLVKFNHQGFVLVVEWVGS